MKNFKFCIATIIAVFSIESANSTDFDSYKFINPPSLLGPANSKPNSSESLNVMAATAARLSHSFNEKSALRGSTAVSIYQRVSAGTVLIVTEDGLGSGAVITNEGHILTNEHVVGNSNKVKVFFKPLGASNDFKSSVETIGTVLKVNSQTDLALVKVDRLPNSVRPIPLKIDGPPSIGEDAHAVGHPRGEVWSYTKGYVSQYRSAYKWSTGSSDPVRVADVIQTQTPINPGNSGGPLVNSEGRMIGINSFGDPKSPGLNFAVAGSTIQDFLKQNGSIRARASSGNSSVGSLPNANCGKGPIGEKRGEWRSRPATLVFFDPDCKGRATVVKIVPDNRDEPISYFIGDKDSNDKKEIALIDLDRNGTIDVTLVDLDGDGKWDLVGENKSGETFASDLKPTKKG